MEMFRVGMTIGSEVFWGRTVETMEEAVARSNDMVRVCQYHGVHATSIVEKVEEEDCVIFLVAIYNGKTGEISSFWAHDESEDQRGLVAFVESMPDVADWAYYANMTEDEALADFAVYLNRRLSQLG